MILLSICSFFLNLERWAIVSFDTQMKSLVFSSLYLKVGIPEITMILKCTCVFRHAVVLALPFGAENILDLVSRHATRSSRV